MNTLLARVPVLAALAGSGWCLVIALGRWRYERACAMVCGPFIPVELVDGFRRATDWRTPLWLGLAPLAAVLLWRVLLGWRRRRSRAQA